MGERGQQAGQARVRVWLRRYRRNRWRKRAKELLTGKNIGVAVLLMFFALPGTYSCTARHFIRGAYYNVATLMAPPNWTQFHESVDLNKLDQSPRAVLVENAISLDGEIARLPKDAYLPGRSDPSGASPELAGRVWTGSQCLFIKRVRLVALDVFEDVDKVRRTRLLSDRVSARAPGRAVLDREFDGSINADAAARRYRQDLSTLLKQAGIPSDACPDAGNPKTKGPFCPRIAVLAYGAPAPCSIWPF